MNENYQYRELLIEEQNILHVLKVMEKEINANPTRELIEKQKKEGVLCNKKVFIMDVM